MKVDYEAVVTDLEELIASKTHHSERDLLRELARAKARHRVPENLLERTIRVFGLSTLTRIAPAVLSTEPEAEATGVADSLGDDAPADHRPPTSEGGHDGSINQGRTRPPVHA